MRAQRLLERLGILGCQQRLDALTDVQDEGDGLARPLRIQAGAVARIGRVQIRGLSVSGPIGTRRIERTASSAWCPRGSGSREPVTRRCRTRASDRGSRSYRSPCHDCDQSGQWWPRSTMQNRLPSGSASTTKSGSSGKLSQSTRWAPSATSRSALSGLLGGVGHVQVQMHPGMVLGRRRTALQGDSRPGGPGRRLEHGAPAAELAGPLLVAERRAPEPFGPLDVAHAEHDHAQVQHPPSLADALSIRSSPPLIGSVGPNR